MGRWGELRGALKNRGLFLDIDLFPLEYIAHYMLWFSQLGLGLAPEPHKLLALPILYY